ncbi:MAG: PspC domain-containing protein [Candidatus Micrarchaeota archaeon]
MGSVMKQLYRSKDQKILFGVCGGIGEYFGIDPTIIRLLTILLALLSFGVSVPGIIVFYLIAYFIIPEEPGANERETEPAKEALARPKKTKK